MKRHHSKQQSDPSANHSWWRISTTRQFKRSTDVNQPKDRTQTNAECCWVNERDPSHVYSKPLGLSSYWQWLLDVTEEVPASPFTRRLSRVPFSETSCIFWSNRRWSKTRNYGTYYYYFFLFGATAPQWTRASPFTKFLDHTQRRTIVGRILLDELLARRR